MRLYASQGVRGTLIDLDTGKPVRKVIWYDDATGEVEAYQVNPDGSIRTDESGAYLKVLLRGRFRFVPRTEPVPNPNPLPRIGPKLGAAKCLRCPSPLTLPGSELCPICNARDRGYRRTMRAEKLASPILDRKCLKCSRLATWSVSDEVEVSPVLGSNPLSSSSPLRDRWKKVAYERGATVGLRYYCDFCYCPPRLVDEKGEIIGDLEVSKRPE